MANSHFLDKEFVTMKASANVLFVLLVVLVGSARAATVAIEPATFTFTEDTVVDIPVLLTGATGVAGVDFVVEYDLADFDNGSQSLDVDGQLLSLTVVNHDFQTDAVAGTRQIKVAAASATGLTVDSGTLLTLRLATTCQGNAQGFAAGRTVTVRVLDVHFFDELGNALAASSRDGQLTLNCTSVGVAENERMSTLKFLYRD